MILEDTFGHNVMAYTALEEEADEHSFWQSRRKYLIQLSQKIHCGHHLGGIGILDSCCCHKFVGGLPKFLKFIDLLPTMVLRVEALVPRTCQLPSDIVRETGLCRGSYCLVSRSTFLPIFSMSNTNSLISTSSVWKQTCILTCVPTPTPCTSDHPTTFGICQEYCFCGFDVLFQNCTKAERCTKIVGFQMHFKHFGH
jgi:hypothetical protein